MRLYILTAWMLGWNLCGAADDVLGPSLALDKAVVDQSGTASIGIALISSGAPIVSLQVDLRVPEETTAISVSRGTDLDAGKTITTQLLGGDIMRVLIYGQNRDSLRNGSIAVVGLKLKAGVLAGVYPVEVSNAIASDDTGQAIFLYTSNGAGIVPGEAVAAPVVLAVMNAASYAIGGVAPGEIVFIGGGGFTASAQAGVSSAVGGTVAVLLDGVRVWFDRIPAPLLYVSPTQLSVVTPYAMAGRDKVLLQIESQGIRSAPVSIPLVTVAPAIFTSNQSGVGQGAIVNEDGTLNGPENPAARGSIITLFGTGEGQTSPPGIDGTIASLNDVRRPILPVLVWIGGAAADVTYAGSAPGQVTGLFQVNLRVPYASSQLHR